MLPTVRHTYQNHHLDSLRWERFVPRSDDIIISTSIKSGTTWTQEILRQLIFYGQEPSTWQALPLWGISPWFDHRVNVLDDNGELTTPRLQQMYKDGAQTFFFKGSNERWREVLSPAELALYDDPATRVLTPECRQWLEQGRHTPRPNA